MPAQPLVDAKQAALAHYGRLVLLAEDAAAGWRAQRIHSSLAGIGLSDRSVRLYLYEGHEAPADIVPVFNDIPTEVSSPRPASGPPNPRATAPRLVALRSASPTSTAPEPSAASSRTPRATATS